MSPLEPTCPGRDQRSGNNKILEFTSSGALLMQWGTGGAGEGQFNDLLGLAVDGHNNLYVADNNNHRIHVFGSLPVPTKSTNWGHIKALYR